MKKKRSSPRPHTVHTKHRRYTVKSFPRGNRKVSTSRLTRKKKVLPFVPGTKIPIQWHTFKRSTQQRIFMHPLDFLKLCTPPKFGKKNVFGYGFSKHSVEGIEKAISKGENLYSLRLDVDVDSKKVVGHEGRHRAFWAWKKGITQVPVVLWHERDNRLIDVENPLNPDDLISEAKRSDFSMDAKGVALIHEKLTDEDRQNIYGKWENRNKEKT